jgi:hypothetical protein
MGMLDGDLAAALYNGFKGKLLSGEIVRNVGATSSDLDAHGDPTDVGQDRWEVEGFFDNYSRFTRTGANPARRDSRGDRGHRDRRNARCLPPDEPA